MCSRGQRTRTRAPTQATRVSCSNCAQFANCASLSPTDCTVCAIARGIAFAAEHVARAVSQFPIYLFIFIVFLNRYVFGLWLTMVRGKKLDDKISGYEPTVTVVIPLFNEGPSIYDTIVSLTELDYPKDKLDIVVVDDCSTDDSYEHACRGAREYSNVRVLKNPHNMGKRMGINHAVRESTSELILSVDSDVIVFPTALKELVARFTSPKVAAVGGRIHVSNPNHNWLTRLQTIK